MTKKGTPVPKSGTKYPGAIGAPMVAVVEWDDAMMEGHWQDGVAPDPTYPLRIYTCGWLVFESAERVVIVQSLGSECHGNVIQIPRGMILKIQKIGAA